MDNKCHGDVCRRSWVMAFALACLGPHAFAANPDAAGAQPFGGMREITGQVETKASGFRLDRRAGHFVQSITLTNISGKPIQGPLYIGAGTLPEGVSMAGAQHATAMGPLLTVPLDKAGLLKAGERCVTVLRFDNRENKPIQYRLRVFQKSAP
jgi:hypothetical protein